jgi:hypothetical protein
MSVEWSEWEGKQLLYADFRGLSRKELIPNLELAASMLEASPGEVLFLINFEGVSIHFAYLRRCSELGQKVIHPKTKRMAILGMDGVKAAMLVTFNKIIGQKSASFKTEQEAKDWLVQ